jgi:DHA2 family multidrug resistance protein
LFGVGMFGSTFLLPIFLQESLGYTPFQAGLVFLPIGIIQGLSAPLAGIFSDRYTPKIPLVLGLLLMAYTFYQFSFLSYLSEKSEIMLPLYIRGVAMGILFAPLMTMAISGIPNHKMAQASGLLNVIRQLGGSFGVAAFGSILTRRTIFHFATYGGQIDPSSASLRRALMKLQYYAVDRTGGTIAEGAAKAKALLASFVGKQAFIGAVDDAFLIAGVFVLIGVVPALFLKTGLRKRAAVPGRMTQIRPGMVKANME